MGLSNGTFERDFNLDETGRFWDKCRVRRGTQQSIQPSLSHGGLMNQQFRFTLALCAVVFTMNTASAVTITLDKNGFADLTGGQITGTGLGSAVPLGTDASAVSFTAVAGGSY